MSKKTILLFAAKAKSVRFPILFTSTFLVLYGFNIAFIGFTTKGGYYVAYLDNHLNYIEGWRTFTIRTTAVIVELLGYNISTTNTSLQVFNYGGFNLVYSCLGYGLMSLFAAFVISYPRPIEGKTEFLLTGLILIQSLNILRFVALAVFWKPGPLPSINHHLIFNVCIYVVLSTKIYRWLKTPINNQIHSSNAKHTIT